MAKAPWAPTGLCLGRGCGAPVCGDELDLARGSPWHYLPQIKSLMGAAALLACGMQDPLLAGGLPKLGWGTKAVPRRVPAKSGEGMGMMPPAPSAYRQSPTSPAVAPRHCEGGRMGHSGDAAKPLLWGWRAGWGPPPCSSEGSGPGSVLHPWALPAPCSPALSLPPALGLASRVGVWHSAEGLAGGRAAPLLPPSSRGVKNSALVMNI